MSILNNYTNDELATIVKHSFSYKEVARKLGYSSNTSGGTMKTIKARIESEGYDTSHFTSHTSNVVDPDEVFVENATVSQNTLRRNYTKLGYPYVCAICGQEAEWNGKPLTLILDHINGHNKDNRLENLRWVCPNCNQQLDTTGSRNIQREPEKKYYCVVCGKEISKGATMCIACNNAKRNTVPLDEMPVTREELKDLIRNNSFVALGKKFGVTDNAVRKWCDKFGLPRHSREIKQYSDAEWSKM